MSRAIELPQKQKKLDKAMKGMNLHRRVERGELMEYS